MKKTGKNMKKTGLICLALVLALGSIGVGYALWSDSLYISGTVNTGSVDVSVISVSDDDSSHEFNWDPGYTKDVASTQVTIIDRNHVLVTVTGAYPSYENFVHFTAAIGGTVPVRLQQIIITNPNPSVIEVDAWDGWGEQRHPGDNADNTLWFHVLQPAEQGATYTFRVEFWYVQYNEFDDSIGEPQ